MAGTENQCLGVAEALGVSAEVKRITLHQPWKSFSPWLGFEHAGIFEPALSPPWPDLVIASGRKSIATSRYIRKASNGKTFTVQGLRTPPVSPRAVRSCRPPRTRPDAWKQCNRDGCEPKQNHAGKTGGGAGEIQRIQKTERPSRGGAGGWRQQVT